MGSSDEESERQPPSKKREKQKKSHQERWETMYQRLVAFRDKYGHCQVPNRYGADSSLGSWVSSQRRQFKEAVKSNPASCWMNEISQEKIRKLEEIGFEWAPMDPRQVPWETRFVELQQFVDDYGHAGVPRRWEPNTQLSNWVSKQRREYKKFRQGKKSSITKQRIELLQSVGFMWKACKGATTTEDSSSDVDAPPAGVLDESLKRASKDGHSSGSQRQASLLHSSSTHSAPPAAFNRMNRDEAHLSFPATDTEGTTTNNNKKRKRKAKVPSVESESVPSSFSGALEEVGGDCSNDENPPAQQAPMKSTETSNNTALLNRANNNTQMEDHTSSDNKELQFRSNKRKKESRLQNRLEGDVPSECLPNTTTTPEVGAPAILVSGAGILPSSPGIARSSLLGSVMPSNSVGGLHNRDKQSTSSSPQQFQQEALMRPSDMMQEIGLRRTLDTAIPSPPQGSTSQSTNSMDITTNARLLSAQVVGNPTMAGIQGEGVRRLFSQVGAARNHVMMGRQLGGAHGEIGSFLEQQRVVAEQRELLLQQLSVSTQQLRSHSFPLLGQSFPSNVIGGTGLPNFWSNLYSTLGFSTSNSAELAAIRNIVNLPTTSTTAIQQAIQELAWQREENLATSRNLGHLDRLAAAMASLQHQESQQEQRIPDQVFVGRQQQSDTSAPSPSNVTENYGHSESSTE